MADILSMIDETDSLETELSAPQDIVPLQFYGARRGTSELEPLRRLMVAMLVDAVRCFQTKFDRRQPGRRQEFAEAQSWIFYDQNDGPFSFRSVCDALEIDPEAIRKGLVRWAQRLSAGNHEWFGGRHCQRGAFQHNVVELRAGPKSALRQLDANTFLQRRVLA